MMKRILYFILVQVIFLTSCNSGSHKLSATIYETSASGNKMARLEKSEFEEADAIISLLPDSCYQEILGFGGSFTESSASLLNRMSKEKRKQIIDAYFGPEGAGYSLTRTHINSCDFSLTSYSYDPVEGDVDLVNFSVDEDMDDLIPMIREALAASENGFKIIASPWTAPPWMKDNNDWKGGKLRPEYRETWALFFSKYLSAYRKEGIDIWGITIENEPLGNSNNWESMGYTPQETVDFINRFLVPRLEKDSNNVVILAYDQNRSDELIEWADTLYKDEQSAANLDGLAIHWYESTNFSFARNLQLVHQMAPEKYLIHTEGCVDSEKPHWKDDEGWYWSEDATDWGWDWAPAADKIYHPKYVPVYRYARDIIGSLNNWVDGWIDWNMVLDREGGPNSARNWAVAPVIVDPDQDEVYFTPLFYTLEHFSKFIRPGAVRIGWDKGNSDLLLTAARNPDGTIAVVLLNMESEAKKVLLLLGKKTLEFEISGRAIETVLIN